MPINVKEMLEQTGLKVAENCFLKPPSPPYIVFLEDENYRGGDKNICILERAITVELYSLKINREKESNIEKILTDNYIDFRKNRTWIESEEFFQTVYYFNLYEKK